MKVKHNEHDHEIDLLKWLPFIGNNYEKSKLIILGESHYEDGDNWQENNPETTNIIIRKQLSEHTLKLYTNTEKILLNKKNPTIKDSLEIWNSVVYWNLVQRLMSSIKERPNDLDYDQGWQVFFELVDVFKPKYCLVLGKSSLGRLGYFLNNNKTKWNKNDKDFTSKNKIINLISNNSQLKIIFVNHPSGSRGFKYEEWAQLINNEIKI